MKLRKLRLTGPERFYEIDFRTDSQPLAVIAGPISTGKSSILEFIDYCLGGDSHPTHPEVARKVRSVALEVEFESGTWCIERAAFAAEGAAWIRSGPLGSSTALQTRLSTGPPSDEDSLSRWLISQLGFEGTSLKVSENNPNSEIHLMSFRDLMWLCFLPNGRLDTGNLLFESNSFKATKLRQVIEVVFGVHDQRAATLMDRLGDLREERKDAQREIASLETFLREEKVPDRESVAAQLKKSELELSGAEESLTSLENEMTNVTLFADERRLEYEKARSELAGASSGLRDRRALLDRLLPLKGQYAEDQRKLTFVGEAKRIFDPLHVGVCPSCLQALEESPTVVDSKCTLCRQVLDPSLEVAGLDVSKEQRSLRDRTRELDRFIVEVEGEIAEAAIRQEVAKEREALLARELDSDVAVKLSPFTDARDSVHRTIVALESESRTLTRYLNWHDSIDRRRNDLKTIEGKIESTTRALDELRTNTPARDDVVESISDRFSELLHLWKFPKLDDGGAPKVDEQFVPWVRGRRYGEIGSTGALTLISVAWHLAIFESARESEAEHPGFLMIDSPQKNLFSSARDVAPDDDEYMDPEIVAEMWNHIEDWSTTNPGSQLVIVDNSPPESVKPFEVVRFTRSRDRSPYGLIDDELG